MLELVRASDRSARTAMPTSSLQVPDASSRSWNSVSELSGVSVEATALDVLVESYREAVELYVRALAVDEVFRELEVEAFERLGMTAAEFLRGYQNDTLPDSLAVAELRVLLSCVDPSIFPE